VGEEAMSGEFVTLEQLRNIIRTLLRTAITANVEALSLEAVLLNRGLLPLEELQAMRTRLTQESEAWLRTFDEAPSDKLLEILQRFEGPVQ
jgi:hypothetical protein